MNQHDIIIATAIENYSKSSPWPEQDAWHTQTFIKEKHIIEKWLAKYAMDGMRILNAGSGGTEYISKGSFIHLDIIEDYICRFDEYIVGSVEDVALPDNAVDGLICVGSVLNYVDAQRTISELSRVLKPGGFFILEFERSESAEFLGTQFHGKYVFSKEYSYNGQSHYLWMYSERHIRDLLQKYHLTIKKCRRIQSLSSLFYRFGVPEEKAAKFANLDLIALPISYLIAHNTLILGVKEISTD